MSEKVEKVPRRSGWIGGGILIFAGIVFLLQNIGWLTRDGDWWMIFLFIPAIFLLSQAYTLYRTAGNEASSGVLVQGLIGLFLAGTALAYLLGIDVRINWNLVWPAVLIVVGLGLLLRRR